MSLVRALTLLLAALCACGDDDTSSDPGSRAHDAGGDGGAADARVQDRAPNANDAAPGTRDGSVPAAGAGGDIANGGTEVVDGGPTAPPDLEPAHAISEYCGDAIRDPVREECDDGSGTVDDACSDGCRVRAVPLIAPNESDGDAGIPDAPKRALGTGPHVAAGGEHGFAVVYAQGEPGGETTLWLQAHDPNGARRAAPRELSGGAVPIDAANPVIAALPGDRYALAWTDGASGTPDVGLRVWDASSGELGDERTAHDASGGFQQDADLLWTGEQLIVAFTDLLDVRYRAFDANLRPLGPARALAASPRAIESSVSLAPFGSGWAAALRANEDALERIEVIAGSLSWSTAPALPGPSGDRPALVALDSEHLLLLFTVGTDPLASGQPSVGRLRVAVLSASAPGDVSTSELAPLRAPYADDASLSQRRPSAARVGERVYVAWEQASPPGDAHGRRAIIAPLQFDSASQILVQGEERALALDAGLDGDQLNPRVAASELFPEGALVSVWEDAPAGTSARSRAPIALELRPSPFVTLAPDAAPLD